MPGDTNSPAAKEQARMLTRAVEAWYPKIGHLKASDLDLETLGALVRDLANAELDQRFTGFDYRRHIITDEPAEGSARADQEQAVEHVIKDVLTGAARLRNSAGGKRASDVFHRPVSRLGCRNLGP